MTIGATKQFQLYRKIALFALALAAASGVLLRFGLYRGFPVWAQNFGAVRHAHSHLMYFGWVTLGLMALIWADLPRHVGRPLPRAVGWQMAATAIASLISFPAFWLNGYGLTTVGSADLPLGSMTAALNGLTWYFFIFLYWQMTRHMVDKPLPIRLWDVAVALMALSSLGAVGLAALVFADRNSFVLQQLFLHLFLDLFALGWFTLSLLGVLWAQYSSGLATRAHLPVAALGLALVPTFLLGMSPVVVTPALFWVAAVANVIAALMLARHLWLLWQTGAALSALERFALLCLALHVATAFVLIWPGFWRWAHSTQLRIFYLHNFLLGWISSGLLGVLMVDLRTQRRLLWQIIAVLWIGGVSLMLLALLGLGFAARLPLSPLFLLRSAAWSSVLPAAAATLAFIASLLPAPPTLEVPNP